MKIEIREGTTADAELIADISRKTFYDTFAKDNTAEDMDIFLSTVFTKRRLMEEVGKKGHYFLLAYVNSEIAGYACLRETYDADVFNNSSAIEIARIYVIDKWLRAGVGRALMSHCLALAKSLQKKVVWLGVWEKNQRAINFYTQWNFQKFNEHAFVLGNDVQCDWLMKKHL